MDANIENLFCTYGCPDCEIIETASGGIDVLPAFEVAGLIGFFCRECAQWHYHLGDPSLPRQGFVSRCVIYKRDTTSKYIDGCYCLENRGPLKERTFKRHQPGQGRRRALDPFLACCASNPDEAREMILTRDMLIEVLQLEVEAALAETLRATWTAEQIQELSETLTTAVLERDWKADLLKAAEETDSCKLLMAECTLSFLTATELEPAATQIAEVRRIPKLLVLFLDKMMHQRQCTDGDGRTISEACRHFVEGSPKK